MKMKGFFFLVSLLACGTAFEDVEFLSNFAKNVKPFKLFMKATLLSSAKYEMGQSVAVPSGLSPTALRRRRFATRFIARIKRTVSTLIRIALVSPARKLKNFVGPLISKKITSSIEDDIKSSQQLSVKKIDESIEVLHWLPAHSIPLLLPSNRVWMPVFLYQNRSDNAEDNVMTVVTDSGVRATKEIAENARVAVDFLHHDLIATEPVTPEGALSTYFLAILLSLLYFLALGRYLSLPLLRHLLRIIGHEEAVEPLMMKKSHDFISCDVVLRESDFTNDSRELAVEKAPFTSIPSDHLQGQPSKYDDDEGSISVADDDDEDGGLSGLMHIKYAHRSEAKEGLEDEDDDSMSEQNLTSRSTSGSVDHENFPTVIPIADVILPSDSLLLPTDNEEDKVLELEDPAKMPEQLNNPATMLTPPTSIRVTALSTPREQNGKSASEITKESRPCNVQKVFEESTFSPYSQTSTPTRKAVIKAFTCVNPFDQNGVILYLSSPAQLAVRKNSIVRARMSSIFIGSEETVLAHSSHDLGLTSFPNYTTNVENSWCAVDLGVGRRLRPTQYCIRHGASSTGNALRSWELRGREKDRDEWEILKVHINDDKLNHAPHSTALWDIESPNKPTMTETGNNPEIIGAAGQLAGQTLKGYRYFLLLQTDVNSSGNHCLFIGGLELYGILMER